MKEAILKLRADGKSYREIEGELGINRGTISYWCNKDRPKKMVAQKQAKRTELKRRCVQYKGGRCEICGFDKYLSALEFHHVDPSSKERNIASLGVRNWNFERVKAELDKCVLVCANCHRGIHSGDLHYSRDSV